jgi:uracil DNA glycosylase
MKSYYDANFPMAWRGLYKALQNNTEKIVSDNVPHMTGHMVPDMKDIFRPFELLTPDQVKAVLIADEPYVKVNRLSSRPDATGLAFEVPVGHDLPTKLVHLRKMASNDELRMRYDGLTYLATEGVLLINATCTAEINNRNCHTAMWEGFLRDVLLFLSLKYTHIVFIFWDPSTKTNVNFVRRRNLHKVIKRTESGEDEEEAVNVLKECNKYLREVRGENSCIQW